MIGLTGIVWVRLGEFCVEGDSCIWSCDWFVEHDRIAFGILLEWFRGFEEIFQGTENFGFFFEGANAGARSGIWNFVAAGINLVVGVIGFMAIG